MYTNLQTLYISGLCCYSVHVDFADEARFQVAGEVVPGVRMAAAEVDASLVFFVIVRLSVVPVDIAHD